LYLESTSLQDLLDKEAELDNSGHSDSEFRIIILEEIKAKRGEEPPFCWGWDDCSSEMLIRCPWRIDCGQ
jgi:hypothetical protein